MENDNVRGYSLRETTIGHAVINPQNADKVETMTPLATLQWCIRQLDELCVSSSADGSPCAELSRLDLSQEGH